MIVHLREGNRFKTFWANFRDDVFAKEPRIWSGGTKGIIDLLDEHLKPYHGEFMYVQNQLIFDTEEDAVAFVLKWS